MKHKLNIRCCPKEAKNNVPKTPWGVKHPPVGWWTVTTEGDCEGRSTKKLGNFYGHVVSIAFYLAHECMYALRFKPCENPGLYDKKIVDVISRDSAVWISLDIDSKTWDMKPEERAEWMKVWLNTDSVEILPRSERATYYAGTYLKLKK